MLWTTSAGLGKIVGAILLSSTGPAVKNHHRRRIPRMGITPRKMDAWLDTLPRI
jgi:hypothetical protein